MSKITFNYVEFFLRGEFGNKYNQKRPLTGREYAERNIADEDVPEECIGYRFLTTTEDGSIIDSSPAVYFGLAVSYADMKHFLEEECKTALGEETNQKKFLISRCGTLELIDVWDSVRF